MNQTVEAPRSLAPAKKRTNWEKIGWVYMRGSGVLLVVLVFGHLFSNLIATPGGVHAIDFGFVGGKLAQPFWQVWDVLLLWLALIHGANGMRTIVNDYVSKQSVAKGLKGALFVATVFLILLGTFVIFTLDPCPAGADPSLVASFCPAQ